jgi:nicotinamide-nucleotide amidase
MNTSPRIALLATGNELVEGDILNTNGQAIAKKLIEHGFLLGLQVTAADIEEDIAAGLKFLLTNHAVVIITGGLGPTSDDRTRYALSQVTQQSLQFNEDIWNYIRERSIQRFGREPHAANRQQALFPEHAIVLPNPHGSAAGCKMQYENKLIYMLPGPPHECLTMFDDYVLPDLLQLSLHQAREKLSWRLQNVKEGEIAALIDEAVKNYPVTTGYRVEMPYLEVKIYTQHHDHYDEMLTVIEKIIGPYIVK